jgi:hypothetical protein
MFYPVQSSDPDQLSEWGPKPAGRMHETFPFLKCSAKAEGDCEGGHPVWRGQEGRRGRQFIGSAAGAPTAGLVDDLALWTEISPGLVKAFVNWQLARGYRIGSINVRLSTVKTYVQLAAQAGYLPGDRAQLIELVHGISHKEGRNIDATRQQTSVGAKKHEPTRISPAHMAC